MALRKDFIEMKEDAPFPDVWVPLSDSLRLLAGLAPFDKQMAHDPALELTSKSVTLTRASTATYIDKAGVLKTAAINEPRFEKEGLLIEGQSSNILLNSTDPTKWNSSSSLTKTVIAADGATQTITCKGVVNLAAAISNFVTSGNITATAGECLTLSCRAKGAYGLLRLAFTQDGTTTSVVFFDAVTGVLHGNLPTDVTVTTSLGVDGYATISATLTTPADGTYVGFITVAKAAADSVIPVGSEFYVQMPQCEKNAVATSYIPTGSAAVTRATDVCTLQRYGNDNYFGPVTFSAEIHLNGKTNADGAMTSRRGIISAKPSSTESYTLMLATSGANAGKPCFGYGNSDFVYGSTGLDDGKGHVVVARFDGSDKYLCSDGVMSVGRAATKPASGNVDATNQNIQIGYGAGYVTPGHSVLNGHIRNIRIWHRALNDRQIKGIR
ncbi:MAG: sialidase [Bacteriophage sp.]|nr:MAG: sialidase [Bacteriophage sp.]